MRKVLVLTVVLLALAVACENKNPAGPEGVGPGGVVVTQTTSSTTTTTTVVGNLSRRYVAFQPPANVPSDMTLFFQLVSAQGLLSSIVERLPLVGSGANAVENVYDVTGVYLMLNGTTGAVKGRLGGASNPLESGGQFQGTLTAKAGSCTAEREFGGSLGPQTVSWVGGTTRQDCPGSPLAFPNVVLVRADAPLPTTTAPPTTTVKPTTTTTTTAPACSYTLSATSASVPAIGGSGEVVVGTLQTCQWIAQSFATWLTVTPAGGSGPAALKWEAAENHAATPRTGTLVVGGVIFTVTQAGATAP